MSEDAKCEKCGARGRRRRFTFAPEGWLFIEAQIDDEEPALGTSILLACSKECAMGMWENGPGDLNRTKHFQADAETIHTMHIPTGSEPKDPWPLELLTTFHQRWGSDKDSPTYDKKEWMKLEAIIQSLLDDSGESG